MGKLLETTALVAKHQSATARHEGYPVHVQSSTRLAVEVVSDLQNYLDKSRGSASPGPAQSFKLAFAAISSWPSAPAFGKSVFAYAPDVSRTGLQGVGAESSATARVLGTRRIGRTRQNKLVCRDAL